VLKRDELLLWLNDHLGETVIALVSVGDPYADDDEDSGTLVLACEGELRHWSARPDFAQPVDELRGMYGVGDVTLNVTDLDGPAALAPVEPFRLAVIWGRSASVRRGEMATILLDENVTLGIFRDTS
jgi:hypothetical protein